MVRIFGHHVTLPVALLALCDLVLFLCSLQLALWTYPTFARAAFATDQIDATMIVVLTVINLASLIAAGLYKRDAITIGGRLSDHLATATSLTIVGFAAYLIPYSMVQGYRFSNLYALAILTVCFQLLMLFCVRAVFVNIFDIIGIKRRILLLGHDSLATKVETWLVKHDHPGYTDVVHYNSFRPERAVRLRWQSSTALAQTALLAQDLPQLARENQIDEIVVAAGDDRDATVWELLECRTSGVNVVDFLTFWERETGRIDLDAIEARWLVYSGGFRSSLLRRFAQRSLDALISILGLAIMFPSMLILALLIRLDSPGPIFYRQERIGKNDCPFQILKFRSMYLDAEADNVPRWAQINDPRVTRLGGFLRRTRMDELPQLINVLKGEMSIVGPRPERPAFVHTLRQHIPFYGVRHLVRPGITGWAQINHEYTASLEDTKLKLEYDLFYVKNHSIFLNLAIILQTLRTVLWQLGAR